MPVTDANSGRNDQRPSEDRTTPQAGLTRFASPSRVVWTVQTGRHTTQAAIRRLRASLFELRVVSNGEEVTRTSFANETDLVNFAEDLHSSLLGRAWML